MTRIGKRPLLLWSTLAIAGGFLVFDWFTGASRPSEAKAQQSVTPAAQTSAAPADWNEVDGIVARLTQSHYVSVRQQLDALPRELFSPTPVAFAELQATPASPPVASQPNDETATPTQEFALSHSLGGVLLGARPLAVVNGKPLTAGETIDGYRLREIQRDYAVFVNEQTSELVTLRVGRVPKKSD